MVNAVRTAWRHLGRLCHACVAGRVPTRHIASDGEIDGGAALPHRQHVHDSATHGHRTPYASVSWPRVAPSTTGMCGRAVLCCDISNCCVVLCLRDVVRHGEVVRCAGRVLHVVVVW